MLSLCLLVFNKKRAFTKWLPIYKMPLWSADVGTYVNKLTANNYRDLRVFTQCVRMNKDGHVVKMAVKWALRQLLRHKTVARYLEEQLSAAFFQLPQIRFVPPGHFYSPLPDLKEIDKERERIYRLPQGADGVDLNSERQQSLLRELFQFYPSFCWKDEPTEEHRYWLNNDYFGWGDAVILFGMLRHFTPKRIIEVGSGFSSALMLDTNDMFCAGRIQFSFIEPHAERLHQLLTSADRSRVNLHEMEIQKVPLEFFDQLEPNDILFVDSSHVAKIGSDVNHILFQIVPRLKTGVLVHFHDVFYPFEYPIDWIREGRAWNEAYVLRAFLQYNCQFEIMMFNNFAVHRWHDYVVEMAPLMARNSGSSLWLRKRAGRKVTQESTGLQSQDPATSVGR
ncbi:MAG: class I SAM-dependent methyltransferase [Pyrinomonadaceae bacterium]|nr:class I SAM-dependent methyltransferase [Pyrinomonadaceae bacterium]